ncbi:hypothetical protein FEZ48_13355 [Marinilactibacillus psychrotolerans]|uniref:Uncharacterized protein n=1 Tax=Marinilactibacillus psychrotolerans TaxID=191770 RepID=A0A5R9BVS3_9LACT|nr:hypothetical protein [Marinilactibacillus psychrotolerans]TLQ04727.1 hypothetical protein FEZ48_13355 [Marinilactibacillus psychrotolerans]
MEKLLEIKELILNTIDHPISEDEKEENLNSALGILDQLIESAGTGGYVYEYPNVGWMLFDNKLSAMEMLTNGLSYKGTFDDYKQETSEMLIDYLLKKESAE